MEIISLQRNKFLEQTIEIITKLKNNSHQQIDELNQKLESQVLNNRDLELII